MRGRITVGKRLYQGPRMTAGRVMKVLFNGTLVGTYVGTGNTRQDLVASREVLTKAGIHIPPGKKAAQLTALGQARSFGLAAQLIFRKGFSEHPYDPYLVAPLIVNVAFCIEVFLKAIAEAVDPKKAWGHDLCKLFDGLPSATKATLQAAFEVRTTENGIANSSLRDALVDMSNAFEEWRYLYEKDDTRIFEVKIALTVIETLDKVSTEMLATKPK